MNSLRERVAGERNRLRQVRQALTAATGKGAAGNPEWVPFYVAIGDYFEAAMARLHEQDIRMGKMLHEKADMEKPEHRTAMAELDERLAGNQEHLAKMLTARAALEAEGADALDDFESAGGAYARYIVENMGHHPGSTDMAREYFTTDDWEYMTMASDEARQLEEDLHRRVFELLPEGVELPES